MSNPKLLCVTPYFVPDGGGLELYAFNIMTLLVRDFGWDVVIVTSSRKGKKITTEYRDGLKIYRLPTLLTMSNTPVHLLWPFWFRQIIAKEKPTIINAHSPVPGISDIAAMVSGKIPFVLTYHAGSMRKGKPAFDLVVDLYERIILPVMRHKARVVICSSDFVRRTIMKRAQHKAVIIHPAVDPAVFKPIPNHPYDTRTVLFVARFANMYRMKGLYYLIEAIKLLPNTKLKVVGEPLDMKDDQVTFVGLKRGQELIDEINTSTLLALPSMANAESFPLVLIEGMACAVPIVGTNCGGIPEIIKDKINGHLVPPENSSALAESLDLILSDPAYAKQLGETGRKMVEDEYSWRQQAKQTDTVLRGVLSQ